MVNTSPDSPSDAAAGPPSTTWPARVANARLHFVTGKSGTGKSTIAAALALALAAGGRKVLLVEVENRQGIAQLFDVPPLAPKELKIATAEGGGVVNALAIEIETAFMEYLDMFYNLGLAGRAMKRIGAIEFATTIAPGLRDVILTGKIKECIVRTDKSGRHVYDAVVVDAPPTGRIARFLDVTSALSDIAKGGPIHSQSEGVRRLLHSDQTAIHLVTLLEALPMQETAEAIAELSEMGLPVGSVIVNRTVVAHLSPADLDKAAEGVIDADAVRKALDENNVTLSDADFAGLLTETIEHATRMRARAESEELLGELHIPRLELPTLADGVDLGSLYELADHLAEQGVR
nr:ArsA-related P-loop ATPase [Mycobacteroides abscessus]